MHSWVDTGEILYKIYSLLSTYVSLMSGLKRIQNDENIPPGSPEATTFVQPQFSGVFWDGLKWHCTVHREISEEELHKLWAASAAEEAKDLVKVV